MNNKDLQKYVGRIYKLASDEEEKENLYIILAITPERVRVKYDGGDFGEWNTNTFIDYYAKQDIPITSKLGQLLYG